MSSSNIEGLNCSGHGYTVERSEYHPGKSMSVVRKS